MLYISFGIILTSFLFTEKINELLKDISRNPFEGIGKPEALKHKYAGFWSRRIDDEHRLIYRFIDDEIQIVKCRHHYD